MSLHNVTPGAKAPQEFNVIIEIPMNADAIKYEVDDESGALFVDRFMSTSMHYPCNYGYIPDTLSDDGDPVDVLVITPVPLIPGVVVTCRPIGILKMQDEAGDDGKVRVTAPETVIGSEAGAKALVVDEKLMQWIVGTLLPALASAPGGSIVVSPPSALGTTKTRAE